MWLWLVACDFSAANKILDSDAARDSAELGDSGTSSPPTDSGPDTTPDTEEDDDRDGWNSDEDCDDDDPAVHPGVADDCDGVDEDCDGATDEDAAGDAYEPNDSVGWPLGSLEDQPEIAVSAALTTADDVDRFAFSIVDDTFDFFTVTATLSNIPSGETWRLSLERTRSDGGEALGRVAESSGSASLSLSLQDEIGVEEGGSYELVVEAVTGTDCGRTYLLGVSQ